MTSEAAKSKPPGAEKTTAKKPAVAAVKAPQQGTTKEPGKTEIAAQNPAKAQPASPPAKVPAKPAQAPALAAVPAPPPAPAARPQVLHTVPKQEPGPARWRPRHWILAISFLLLVLIPGALGVAYLYTKAADQYHSTVGFSVHTEESSNPLDFLGAFTQSGGNSASDADILYEYIRSQQLVEEIASELDLVAIYNRAKDDPVFTLGQDPTIEDLHWYWEWMVSVAYDGGTGIIEVEARAFTPEDAHAIADAIVRRSTALINALSQEARQDAIRFAKRDLAEAEERLRAVRRKLRAFRDVEQIIDPTADVEQRMGLLTALEGQLAEALVSRDVLLGYAAPQDSRVRKLEDQIAAIEKRIENEKAKLGSGNGENAAEAERMAEVVGTYEELVMDREFAQQAYAAVLASYEEARTEARRQNRYLATHVGPTRAQESLFPKRWLLGLALVLFLLMSWIIIVLIIFNVRDTR